MRRPAVAVAALGLASFLFGATFVMVKDAITVLPPLGFVGWRFSLGAAALLAISRPRRRTTVRHGVVAGLLLFAGYAFQTRGLVDTTASASGLITGLYVVFTPLLAAAVARRRPRLGVMAGALVAFAGLVALTSSEGLRARPGDLWTLGAAIAFAGHIVYLSRVARHHPVIAFTGVQLAVVAFLGLTGSLILEEFAAPGGASVTALLVTGLAVSGGAFLLQVWSQTVIGAARTALVLALEPVFAAAAGAVILGERLGTGGILGGLLILTGIHVVLAATGDEDDLPAAEAVSAAH